jgi:hypothetical protein
MVGLRDLCRLPSYYFGYELGRDKVCETPSKPSGRIDSKDTIRVRFILA